MQNARWSTALATAALLALPVVGSAQSTQSSSQQNPPAQTQPPATTSQQPPATSSQPPATTAQQPPATTAQQPPATSAAAQPGQIDAAAAKEHLSEARETLSQITSMPEAAKLQGAARSQVSQLISDFNALITTQSDWRSAYAKVDSDLTTILGPEAGSQSVGTSGSTAATAGATGTAGTTGAAGTTAAGSGTAGATGAAGDAKVDPAIRSKLVEFRTHLSEFEKAAGGETPAASPASSASEPAASAGTGSPAGSSSASMPPAAATSSTANPSNPAQNPTQNPMQGAAGEQPRPTGTSGVSASSPSASASDAARAGSVADRADAQKELDAISAILDRSKTGTLSKAQTTQLKQHIEALRAILARQ